MQTYQEPVKTFPASMASFAIRLMSLNAQELTCLNSDTELMRHLNETQMLMETRLQDLRHQQQQQQQQHANVLSSITNNTSHLTSNNARQQQENKYLANQQQQQQLQQQLNHQIQQQHHHQHPQFAASSPLNLNLQPSQHHLLQQSQQQQHHHHQEQLTPQQMLLSPNNYFARNYYVQQIAQANLVAQMQQHQQLLMMARQQNNPFAGGNNNNNNNNLSSSNGHGVSTSTNLTAPNSTTATPTTSSASPTKHASPSKSSNRCSSSSSSSAKNDHSSSPVVTNGICSSSGLPGPALDLRTTPTRPLSASSLASPSPTGRANEASKSPSLSSGHHHQQHPKKVKLSEYRRQQTSERNDDPYKQQQQMLMNVADEMLRHRLSANLIEASGEGGVGGGSGAIVAGCGFDELDNNGSSFHDQNRRPTRTTANGGNQPYQTAKTTRTTSRYQNDNTNQQSLQQLQQQQQQQPVNVAGQQTTSNKKYKGEFDEPSPDEVAMRERQLDRPEHYHSEAIAKGECACVLGSEFRDKSCQDVLQMIENWRSMDVEQRIKWKWDVNDLPKDIPLSDIKKFEDLRREFSDGRADFGGASKRKPLGIRGTRQFLLILYCLWGHPGRDDPMQRDGYCPHCFAKIKKANEQSTLVRVVNHFNMKHRRGANPRLSPQLEAPAQQMMLMLPGPTSLPLAPKDNNQANNRNSSAANSQNNSNGNQQETISETLIKVVESAAASVPLPPQPQQQQQQPPGDADDGERDTEMADSSRSDTTSIVADADDVGLHDEVVPDEDEENNHLASGPPLVASNEPKATPALN